MITLHHLETSRSTRIIWILEELGLPYEMITHQRNPMTRLAPPELKAIHPLGKSPVIVDDGAVMAESGAIIEYLVEKYGNGRLRPAVGSADWRTYLHFMHFAEGSAMLPLMLKLYTGFLGEGAAPLQPRIDSEIVNHIGYLNGHLTMRDYLCEMGFTAADIQVSYLLENMAASGAIAAFPALGPYMERLHARPAFQRAIEKGGPIPLKR
jgi:glutathione S-transferase